MPGPEEEEEVGNWLKWGDYEDVRAEGASEVIGLDALIHTAEAVEGDPK